MTGRQKLLNWLMSRAWDEGVLIECAKSAIERTTISWPTTKTHYTKELFFGGLLDVFKGPVTREETISVLDAWAGAYRADGDYLLTLAACLRQQSGSGANIEVIPDKYPPPGSSKQVAGVSGLQTRVEEEKTSRRDTKGMKDKPASLPSDVDDDIGFRPESGTCQNVFFSYSHSDEILRNELAKHLKLLDGGLIHWLP